MATCNWNEEVSRDWKEAAWNWKEAAACSWRELDLEDEMTSLEWGTEAQRDWAHGIWIPPGDVLVCVWYVHLC